MGMAPWPYGFENGTKGPTNLAALVLSHPFLGFNPFDPYSLKIAALLECSSCVRGSHFSSPSPMFAEYIYHIPLCTV